MGNQFPFICLIVITLSIPILEILILSRNFRVMSPVTMFCGAFTTLYVFPYFIHFYVTPDRHLATLSSELFGVAFSKLLLFQATFVASIVFYLFRLRGMTPEPLICDRIQLKRHTRRLLFFFVISIILMLGAGVGFSPLQMIKRAFDPRSFTYIRASTGPLVLIHACLAFSLLTVAVVRVADSPRLIRRWLFLGLCAFLSILGGTKSSFAIPLIVVFVVFGKTRWVRQSKLRKTSRAILLSMMLGFSVVAGFMFIGTPGTTLSVQQSVARIPAYHREAYYLPLVIDTFEWKAEYPKYIFIDSIIAGVPRAFWRDKPYVGLWARYFRPAFEPEAVEYHVSTFGCLAEAHMLVGNFGPILYGWFWAFLLFHAYRILITGRSLYQMLMACIFSVWIYFLLRTGFFGTNFPILIIYMTLGWLLVRKCSPSRRRQLSNANAVLWLERESQAGTA